MPWSCRTTLTADGLYPCSCLACSTSYRVSFSRIWCGRYLSLAWPTFKCVGAVYLAWKNCPGISSTSSEFLLAMPYAHISAGIVKCFVFFTEIWSSLISFVDHVRYFLYLFCVNAYICVLQTVHLLRLDIVTTRIFVLCCWWTFATRMCLLNCISRCNTVLIVSILYTSLAI